MYKEKFNKYRYNTECNSPNTPHSIYEGERVISNHSGYSYSGSENFEHDDTGGKMNYSGVEDIIFSSFAENNNWEEGYDY